MKNGFAFTLILLLVLLSMVVLTSCDESQPECSVPAVIRDLRGLDGCGFVFELQDGSRLEPQQVFRCGTPPLAEMTDDPLADFPMVDGKNVLIGYEEINSASICMVGKTVKITCITDARSLHQE
jgi:hypothetical protein